MAFWSFTRKPEYVFGREMVSLQVDFYITNTTGILKYLIKKESKTPWPII